jgi:hypothetical protein
MTVMRFFLLILQFAVMRPLCPYRAELFQFRKQSYKVEQYFRGQVILSLSGPIAHADFPSGVFVCHGENLLKKVKLSTGIFHAL